MSSRSYKEFMAQELAAHLKQPDVDSTQFQIIATDFYLEKKNRNVCVYLPFIRNNMTRIVWDCLVIMMDWIDAHSRRHDKYSGRNIDTNT